MDQIVREIRVGTAYISEQAERVRAIFEAIADETGLTVEAITRGQGERLLTYIRDTKRQVSEADLLNRRCMELQDELDTRERLLSVIRDILHGGIELQDLKMKDILLLLEHDIFPVPGDDDDDGPESLREGAVAGVDWWP